GPNPAARGSSQESFPWMNASAGEVRQQVLLARGPPSFEAAGVSQLLVWRRDACAEIEDIVIFPETQQQRLGARLHSQTRGDGSSRRIISLVSAKSFYPHCHKISPFIHEDEGLKCCKEERVVFVRTRETHLRHRCSQVEKQGARALDKHGATNVSTQQKRRNFTPPCLRLWDS
ncbi:hypothetical protein IRJ41_024935, partial [Triplophysa rosa]